MDKREFVAKMRRASSYKAIRGFAEVVTIIIKVGSVLGILVVETEGPKGTPIGASFIAGAIVLYLLAEADKQAAIVGAGIADLTIDSAMPDH